MSYTNGKAHEKSISDSGRYVVVNSKFISSEGLIRKYSNHCLSPTTTGDVLMVMSDIPNGRAIAKCYWVETNQTYTVNQRICTLSPQSIDGKFLFYKLDRNPFYLAFDDGAKQTNLRKDDVLCCPLGIPKSVDEQRAIAAALVDVDALIAALDQHIAKKRDLKQAAMQQLLTGSRRLPGFQEGWKRIQAGEIGRFRGGSGFPTTFQGAASGTYPFFKVSDMNNQGNETFMIAANNWIFEEVRKQLGATAFPCDSIVFAKVGAAVFLERKKILTVPSCLDNNMAAFLLDTSRADYHFIHYLLLNKKLGDLVSTTALPSLSGSVLSKMEFVLPPVSEQTAIASVLSDMDAELATLVQRRDKTSALKQGMMQELLTGRTRLV